VYKHTYTCIYIHACIRIYVHIYTHTYIQTYTQTYVHINIHTKNVWISTSIPAQVNTCVHTRIHAHLLTHIHVFTLTCTQILAYTQLSRTVAHWTHCNTLQHTATYCNALQRTATHRSRHTRGSLAFYCASKLSPEDVCMYLCVCIIYLIYIYLHIFTGSQATWGPRPNLPHPRFESSKPTQTYVRTCTYTCICMYINVYLPYLWLICKHTIYQWEHDNVVHSRCYRVMDNKTNHSTQNQSGLITTRQHVKTLNQHEWTWIVALILNDVILKVSLCLSDVAFNTS